MKLTQILCFFVFLCANMQLLFSQAFSYEDVVYLKNGSIIKGAVLEVIPTGNVKIKTKDGNIFVYAMLEVEKIVKEETQTITKTPTKSEYTEIKGFNLGAILEGAFCLGLQGKYARNNDMPNGHIVLNTMLTPKFSLGLLLGWDRYYDAYLNRSFFPLMLDIRYYPLKGRISPSLIMDAGYTMGYGGGIVINPALGLKANLTKKLAFHTNFGYRYEQFTNASAGYGTNFNGYLSFVSLRAGFSYQFLANHKK